MYHIIKCYTCNNSIGEFVAIFNFLKEQKIKDLKTDTSIYNYQFDENLDISFDDIFKDLHITNMCCKKSIFTNIEFYQLYNFDV